MITGKEDAANNYARGHYTIGKEQIEVDFICQEMLSFIVHVPGDDGKVEEVNRKCQQRARLPRVSLLRRRNRLRLRISLVRKTESRISQETDPRLFNLPSTTGEIT